ncbi:MAG: hypothetical protein Kow0042_17420 [Calditrichia bacterium]
MKPRFLIVLIFVSCMSLLLYFSVLANEEAGELKFSHQLHVVDNDLECETCHAPASESTSGTDNLMPTMETCGNCHDIELDEGCQLCHSDLENPRAVPRISDYSSLFSHETHLTAGLECVSCHQEVQQKAQAFPYTLPSMSFCMECHGAKGVSQECMACHKPSERLKPLTHGVNFIHEHGDQARSATTATMTAQKCAMCHTKSFCQNCHEGDNLDRTTHPLNYAFTHSLDASGKERDCMVCHTERSFCLDCHRDFQVMPHNHTVGWVNRLPGDGGLHRVEAQNDIENCMACHEQNAQQVCKKCHYK